MPATNFIVPAAVFLIPSNFTFSADDDDEDEESFGDAGGEFPGDGNFGMISSSYSLGVSPLIDAFAVFRCVIVASIVVVVVVFLVVVVGLISLFVSTNDASRQSFSLVSSISPESNLDIYSRVRLQEVNLDHHRHQEFHNSSFSCLSISTLKTRCLAYYMTS